MDLEKYSSEILRKYSGQSINIIDCDNSGSYIIISTVKKNQCRVVDLINNKGYQYNGCPYKNVHAHYRVNSKLPIILVNNNALEKYIKSHFENMSFSLVTYRYEVKMWQKYPKLFTNLVDSNLNQWIYSIALYLDSFETLSSHYFLEYLKFNHTLLNEGNIKKIFGISVKYMKIYGHRVYDIPFLRRIRDVGLSPQEFEQLVTKYHNYIQVDRYEILELTDYRYLLNYSNKLPFWGYNFVGAFVDYLRMRKRLKDNLINISDFPRHPIDITLAHDQIIRKYNQYQDQINKQELAIQQSTYKANFYLLAKQYEFEDDKYILIACSDLAQLSVEGKKLCHCVGSYVASVSAGKEYILFLRKKSEPDTPYFTVDVTPNKICRQIHGMYNCNVPKELNKFIKAWADTFQIDISNTSGCLCSLQ